MRIEKEIWILTPPQGDSRLKAFQRHLERTGTLDLGLPPPFIPWPWKDAPPTRHRVRQCLPLQTQGWGWDEGKLGLALVQKELGMVHLGWAREIPTALALDWKTDSVLVTKVLWIQQGAEVPSELEITELEKFRVGLHP